MSCSAILTGALVAVFAFILATVRDELRYRRDRRQREKAVLAAMREEIASIRETSEANQHALADEIEALQNQRQRLNPLDPLASGLWELARVEMPRVLINDAEALAALREISRRISRVNETIRSREAFRIGFPHVASGRDHESMERYNKLLEGYDRAVTASTEGLIRTISDFEPRLGRSSEEGPTLPQPEQ